MSPPLTDFFALAGIALVVCAGALHVPFLTSGTAGRANAKGRWIAGLCFLVLWIPVGAAQLPIAAYIRGITSDLSITLVTLAGLSLCRRFFGLRDVPMREYLSLSFTVAVAAVCLYPLALGWGDWDAYRPGWGSAGMWASLLLLCVACWLRSLRLLPILVSLALLAWAAQALESTNLWDYLLDPWLAAGAIFYSVRVGARQWRNRLRGRAFGVASRPLP